MRAKGRTFQCGSFLLVAIDGHLASELGDDLFVLIFETQDAVHGESAFPIALDEIIRDVVGRSEFPDVADDEH